MPREESTEKSHTMVLRVAHIRGGNFVTRGTRAASNLESYYENSLVSILCYPLALLMATGPARNFALYFLPSVPPPRPVYSASGPIMRMAVYVEISIHRVLRYMSDFTWEIWGIGEINATPSR